MAKEKKMEVARKASSDGRHLIRRNVMNMETSLVLAPLGLMLHPQVMARERERQADSICLVLPPRHADDKLLNAKSKLPIDIQRVSPCSPLKKMIHDRAPALEPRPAAVWSSFPSGDGRALGTCSCQRVVCSSTLSIRRRRSCCPVY